MSKKASASRLGGTSRTVESPPDEAVSSPCVNLCKLDDERICRGCFRHVDEIIAWRDADNAARRAILERVASRRQQRLSAVRNSSRPA